MSNQYKDRQRQSNTPTVSKRISNFSPTSHGSVKNSSSFHTLLSQLQPSTTKNPKNYSQQKQMLLTKKNEIIKNAIKQSLSINKKPGTPKLGKLTIFLCYKCKTLKRTGNTPLRNQMTSIQKKMNFQLIVESAAGRKWISFTTIWDVLGLSLFLNK